MLWDLLQQLQISSSTRSANQAHLKASLADHRTELLEAQVQQLSLACQAMWELLKHQGMTDADLERKMTEIDLRDGVRDGRLTVSQASQCPSCSKPVKSQRSHCYWCGEKLSNATPFFNK